MKVGDKVWIVKPENFIDGFVAEVKLQVKGDRYWLYWPYIRVYDDRIFTTEKEATDYAIKILRRNMANAEDELSIMSERFHFLYDKHL